VAIEFSSLRALEILDSRGRPTLSVRATLSDGRSVRAGVPSGASTGSREAVELRDHDARYGGLGVRQAAAGVNGPIAEELTGRPFSSLDDVDQMLRQLDGTPDKSRLGANALIGVSMAAAQAFALDAGQPLWQYLRPEGVTPRLPVPHFNVINGGAHAINNLDFQEFMIAPVGAPSLPEAVRAGAEIYRCLRSTLVDRNLETGLGDEGGFAPQVDDADEALALLVKAIGDAGYPAGRDGVAIALDPRDDRYQLGWTSLTSEHLIGYYAEIVDRFPVWSIKTGWASATPRAGTN